MQTLVLPHLPPAQTYEQEYISTYIHMYIDTYTNMCTNMYKIHDIRYTKDIIHIQTCSMLKIRYCTVHFAYYISKTTYSTNCILHIACYLLRNAYTLYRYMNIYTYIYIHIYACISHVSLPSSLLPIYLDVYVYTSSEWEFPNMRGPYHRPQIEGLFH